MKIYSLLLLLTGVAASHAATLRYSAEVLVPFDGSYSFASVPRFNTSLGTLTSVTLQVYSRATGVVSRENLDNQPLVGSSTVTCSVDLYMGGANLKSNLISSSRVMSFAPFDGVSDFAGTSALSLNAVGTQTTTMTFNASSFEGITGSGSNTVAVQGNYAFGWATNARGSTTPTASFTGKGSQSITVIYNYTPA